MQVTTIGVDYTIYPLAYKCLQLYNFDTWILKQYNKIVLGSQQGTPVGTAVHNSLAV